MDIPPFSNILTFETNKLVYIWTNIYTKGVQKGVSVLATSCIYMQERSNAARTNINPNNRDALMWFVWINWFLQRIEPILKKSKVAYKPVVERVNQCMFECSSASMPICGGTCLPELEPLTRHGVLTFL